MNTRAGTSVRMIPIDKITVVNGRSRGQTKFRQIVTNISHIGLKKPITVARRFGKDGETHYDLVCGQGRLEAFQSLGQREVPALIVDVDQENLLLMSLAENLARRQRTTIEMAKEILALHNRGYRPKDISEKVDLDVTYVRGIVRLLTNGEERLLKAVEKQQIPLSMAIEIAESNDQEVQRLMTDAYAKKELRGRELIMVRKLLDRRKNKGKHMYERGAGKGSLPADTLMKAYKREVVRLQHLVKKAESTDTRLQFLVTAFKKLMKNDDFVGLIKRESLGGIPRCLMDRVTGKERFSV